MIVEEDVYRDYTEDFDERLALALFNAGLSGPCLKPLNSHSIEPCALKDGHPGRCLPQWAVASAPRPGSA